MRTRMYATGQAFGRHTTCNLGYEKLIQMANKKELNSG